MNFICLNIIIKNKGRCIINKRCMFMKSGKNKISNLKRSGDIISTVDTKMAIKVEKNNTSVLNLNSLDLVNTKEKEQEYIIEKISSIPTTTIITLKNINDGRVFPMQVNRNLAFYGKINKNFTVGFLSTENIFTTKNNYKQFKANAWSAAEEALQQKKINKDQFLIYTKRLNALDLSYVHATIGDIANKHVSVKGDEDYITIIYHMITTKRTIVDYGVQMYLHPSFYIKI